MFARCSGLCIHPSTTSATLVCPRAMFTPYRDHRSPGVLHPLPRAVAVGRGVREVAAPGHVRRVPVGRRDQPPVQGHTAAAAAPPVLVHQREHLPLYR
jgi:hypothetical protein